jgi:hypothetical protein
MLCAVRRSFAEIQESLGRKSTRIISEIGKLPQNVAQNPIPPQGLETVESNSDPTQSTRTVKSILPETQMAPVLSAIDAMFMVLLSFMA